MKINMYSYGEEKINIKINRSNDWNIICKILICFISLIGDKINNKKIKNK